MHFQSHHHHVHVPVFHPFQAPHVEWHEVGHPVRAALITVGAVATIAVGGLAIESATDIIARAAAPAPATLEWEQRPLDPEWRWSPPTVETKSMHRRGAETRSLDHMWRKR